MHNADKVNIVDMHLLPVLAFVVYTVQYEYMTLL